MAMTIAPPATLERMEPMSKPPAGAAAAAEVPAVSILRSWPPRPPPMMPEMELPTGPRLNLLRSARHVATDRTANELNNQSSDVHRAPLLEHGWRFGWIGKAGEAQRGLRPGCRRAVDGQRHITGGVGSNCSVW